MKNPHSSRIFGLLLAGAAGAVALGCGVEVVSSSNGPEPKALFNGIKGTYLNTYVWDSSTTMVPPSEAISVAALVPQPSGGYTTFEGTFSADGNFEIPGVPQGSYLLRIQPDGGRANFYWTSERVIELGEHYANRPDLAPISTSTPLIFDVGGLSPWQEGDYFEMFSPGARTFGATTLGLTPGVTSLSGASFDALEMNPANLIEGEKGDLLYTTLHVTRATTGLTYTSIAKVFTPPPFSMQDGQPTTLTGMFSDVPQKTLSLNWKRAAFAALVQDAHPGAVHLDSVFDVYAETGGTSRISASIPVTLIYGTYDSTADFTGDLTYGNPFPSAWDLVATARVGFGMNVMLPGAADSKLLNGEISCYTPLNNKASLTLSPGLGPVKDILVNGSPAADWLTGAGLTPTVSWSPPALGTAVRYRVVVRRLEPMGSSKSLAVFSTTATSVELPEGLLEAGKYYGIHVFAYDTPINLAERDAPDAYGCSSVTFTHVIEP